ncbi:hypothetical protein [Bacillus alveayuensis]|jgi:hypothetical protein|uniref:hypothetical protein n=1 Tax=Aeribacillus alveayuensis TaxID=279215 RepID=UPI000698FA15|nr:hypothetical protein [Bacillus alveayuensis]
MKKKWLPAALVAMIAIPTAAFATETKVTEDVQIPNQLESTPILKGHGRFGGHFMKHFGMDEEQEQKLLTLVEKYAPESKEEWQQTIDKRQALLKELRELNPKEMLKEKQDEIIKEREAKLDELLDQLAAGEITKEEFKEKLKEAWDNRKERLQQWKNEKLSITKEFVEKERELHKQFREALESEDKEALAELLPKFLEHLKVENERLAQMLENMKQNQAANGENGL